MAGFGGADSMDSSNHHVCLTGHGRGEDVMGVLCHARWEDVCS